MGAALHTFPEHLDLLVYELLHVRVGYAGLHVRFPHTVVSTRTKKE